jgi:hypothetical protein
VRPTVPLTRFSPESIPTPRRSSVNSRWAGSPRSLVGSRPRSTAPSVMSFHESPTWLVRGRGSRTTTSYSAATDARGGGSDLEDRGAVPRRLRLVPPSRSSTATRHGSPGVLVPGGGVEPPYQAPKARVLPLDHPGGIGVDSGRPGKLGRGIHHDRAWDGSPDVRRRRERAEGDHRRS